MILGIWDDLINGNRFVTGVQETERCHVEKAFEICVKTARLAIQEFRNSMLD